MFKNILLPTDGSTLALRAAEIVAEQATTVPGAHVTIAVAIALGDINHSDLDEEVLKRQNERIRHHAEDALKTVAAIFERRGVAHAIKVLEGDPTSAAVATEAETGNYDLIVMSSRGLGMSRSDPHYAGSVTEHVIRRVNIPVLVIPQHEEK
jgi:nucleotide-binding universal stress UspA family protein